MYCVPLVSSGARSCHPVPLPSRPKYSEQSRDVGYKPDRLACSLRLEARCLFSQCAWRGRLRLNPRGRCEQAWHAGSIPCHSTAWWHLAWHGTLSGRARCAMLSSSRLDRPRSLAANSAAVRQSAFLPWRLHCKVEKAIYQICAFSIQAQLRTFVDT